MPQEGKCKIARAHPKKKCASFDIVIHMSRERKGTL